MFSFFSYLLYYKFISDRLITIISFAIYIFIKFYKNGNKKWIKLVYVNSEIFFELTIFYNYKKEFFFNIK